MFRQFLVLVAAALPAFPSAAAALQDQPPGRPATPPHVLFYLMDTTRADSMSPYGSARPTSPFLDKLGREGVVFERCYAPAPWTKPSMAAILTSKYPSTTGVYKVFDRLDSRHVTLPEAFALGGYLTVGFSANPFVGKFGNYRQDGFHFFTEAVEIIRRDDPLSFASGSARAINQHLLQWFDRHAATSLANGRRLFLYLHSIDPHEEYAPAEPFQSKFTDPEKTATYRADRVRLLREAKPMEHPADTHRTRAHFDKIGLDVNAYVDASKRLYDADILANDREIEILFAELSRRGLTDNLLVVITADHGEEFMEHGGTGHGYALYNELIHVPLLVWSPGIVPGGKRIDPAVSSLDIYPTLLELAGLPVPDGIQGHSLVPLIKGLASPPRAIFSEKRQDPRAPASITEQQLVPGGTAVSVIRYPLKYVRNFRDPRYRDLPEHELYDLGEDPGELENLAEKLPKQVQTFQEEVQAWLLGNLARAGKVDVDSPDELSETDRELLRKLGYIK